MKKSLLAITVLLSVMFAPIAEAQGFWLRSAVAAYKGYQAYTLTDADITKYVKEYIKYSDAHNRVAGSSSAYAKRLRRITQGLTKVNGIPLNFKVYMVSEVNAFACADGSVRIYSALMDKMNDDELLGIIGHEMGHVAHHDTRKAFKQALYTSAIMDAMGAMSSRVARLTDSQLGALSQVLMQAKYSRSQEKDADDFGYAFLKKAGKNPWAMARSFEKLKALQGSSRSSRVNQLFSSHPDLDTRIKRMSERAQKDGFKRS